MQHIEQGVCSICCDTLSDGVGERRFLEVQLLFLPAVGPVGRWGHLHVTQEETSLDGGRGAEARGDELWGTRQPPRSWER